VNCAPKTLRNGEWTVLDLVRKYYGEVLEKTGDLRTNACCTAETPPDYVTEALAQVHDEVRARYYGCGLVLPEALAGCRVMDLGCGSGRDVYLLSKLVGEAGRVVGVDMTAEQLAVAERHLGFHSQAFGYAASNVSFHAGYIECLADLGLEPASFDLIVSNCVINLSPDKAAVLQGAYDLLKPGGELYFADVYADRRIAESVARDPVLYGECLGGALYWHDFLNLAKRTGFLDPRLVADRPIEVEDGQLRKAIGATKFYSATYRLFKLPGLEPACEDYGQAVRYLGSIPHHENALRLDTHHRIETGKLFAVCGNTYDMLSKSRLAPHFEFFGDRARHFGIFPDCGLPIPFSSGAGSANIAQSAGSCC
jgi:SAM-dependent methyltransferase